jgi:hypothetical protein
LKKAVDLSEMQHKLGATLQDIEVRARRLALPWDELGVQGEQEKLEKLRQEFGQKHTELERLMDLAKQIQVGRRNFCQNYSSFI